MEGTFYVIVIGFKKYTLSCNIAILRIFVTFVRNMASDNFLLIVNSYKSVGCSIPLNNWQFFVCDILKVVFGHCGVVVHTEWL